MRCLTKQASAERWQRSWVLVLLACIVWLAANAWSKDAAIQGVTRRVNHAVVLSAQATLDLPLSVKQALERSIAVAFVHQAVVRQPRWYWTDREVARKERLVRIQYQALTREWRVSVVNDHLEHGPVQSALHQSVSSLETALALASRVHEWEVATAEQVDGDKGLLLDYRFALDMGLMARPFQLGSAANSSWSYQLEASFKVPDQSIPAFDATLSLPFGLALGEPQR